MLNKKTNKQASGVRSYSPRDTLFNENDLANSLFIIQSGQVRLFRPKGRGFVELAVLRSGEMIGEMSYFDEGIKKRSCSAEAIIQTEVIEISFAAFGKTLSELSPWLRSIIHSLVARLKTSNEKIKSLESNSVGLFKKKDGIGQYTFFHGQDIMRILSTLYLVSKSYGEIKGEGHLIHNNRVRFFIFDVYNIQEVKYEEMISILQAYDLLAILKDKQGQPNIINTLNTEKLREIMVFFNGQRMLQDDKKITISPKCEQFLDHIVSTLEEKGAHQGNLKERYLLNLSPILDDFKNRNIPIDTGHLEDAVNAGFLSEVFVAEGDMKTEVYRQELFETFPFMRVINAIQKANVAKLKGR